MLDHDMLAELMGEQSRLESKGNGGNFMDNFVIMPKNDGHITVRILGPAKPGVFDGVDKPKLYCGTRIHEVNERKFHCPKVLKDKRWIGDCPICWWYNHLYRESDKPGLSDEERESIRKQAKAFKPYERYYYNVIVRSVYNEETGQLEKNVGPKILSVGKGVHEMIITGIIGNPKMEEKGYGDVTDVKTGRDFKIIKTMKSSNDKKGGNTLFAEYAGSKFLEPSPLGTKEEIEKWTAELHNLAALRHVESEDELKLQLKIHLGVVANVQQGGYNASEFQRGAVSAASNPSPVVQNNVSSQKENVKIEKEIVPPAFSKAEVESKASESEDGDVSIDSAEFMQLLHEARANEG